MLKPRAQSARRTLGEYFIYDQALDALFYDPDGTGAAQQRLIATFTNNPILAASDIVVI